MAGKGSTTGRTPLHKQRQLKSRAQTQTAAMVPFRWIAIMFGLAVAGAAVCAWGTLAFLFWQGSWQLLYHPTATLERTPASAGLKFDTVAFGATADGQPTLEGWWIPAAGGAGYTALYLHGSEGNMGDTVEMLSRLHDAGLNVMTFDYRGYGHSRAAHPSEKGWREDADAALSYLTQTRHVAAQQIVVVGRDLGANLALEVGAAHAELGGVALIAPLSSPMTPVFHDPRAKLVPAEVLVSDRWDWRLHAPRVRVPVLWYEWTVDPGALALPQAPDAFDHVTAAKSLVWLIPTRDPQGTFGGAMQEWLHTLPAKGQGMPACLAGSDLPC